MTKLTYNAPVKDVVQSLKDFIKSEVAFYLTGKHDPRYCLCGCGKHFQPKNRYHFFYPTKIPNEHRKRYLALFNVRPKPIGVNVRARKRKAA